MSGLEEPSMSHKKFSNSLAFRFPLNPLGYETLAFEEASIVGKAPCKIAFLSTETSSNNDCSLDPEVLLQGKDLIMHICDPSLDEFLMLLSQVTLNFHLILDVVFSCSHNAFLIIPIS